MLLHLGIAAQFAYDSNVFFANINPQGSFMFSVLPSLDLGTRSAGGPHTLDFRLHAGMDYNEYLTSDTGISRHRSFGVQAGTLLTIMPGHRVSVDLYDNFVRSSQPPYVTNEAYNLDRDVNLLGARMRVRPGGGRLEWDLGYTFGIDFFEVNILKDLDVMTHSIDTRLQWKFFPKTALYLQGTEVVTIYPHPGSTAHPDGYPLHVVLGVQGLITPKLTVNVYVGYGNGFYVSGPSPNTGVGGIDLRWKPFYSSSMGVGYRHDFVNSLLGTYYDLDTAFISWAQQLWRFLGTVELSYSNIRYQGVQPQSAVVPLERKDNNVNFGLRFEYPFKRWLTLSLGYLLQYNNSNSKLDAGAAGLLPVDYLKQTVWLRLSVLY